MTISGPIIIGRDADPIEEGAARILADRAGERLGRPIRVAREDEADEAPAVVVGTPGASRTMEAALAEGSIELPEHLGREGFAFVVRDDGPILVGALEPLGTLYGVGAVLRKSRLGAGAWSLGPGDHVSSPDKELRPIYFATHFGNWYCHASEGDLRRYLEDLALWGYNALVTWFDLHHYRSFEDGAEAWDRLARLDEIARGIGLKVGRIAIANESFEGQAPPELRAVGRLPGTGYDTDLCPSKPEARALILADRRAFLEKVSQTTSLDWLCLWPYDQGGCNCEACSPWPATYMDLGRDIAELTSEILPETEIQLSAWWIGTHRPGEDEAFFDRLYKGERWFSTIVVGTVELRRWLNDGRRLPDDYRFLLFPEISMFDALPWGGRGGNPAPRKFADEMAELGTNVGGAMPYSEGRYEDVNKALWAQFQWDPRRDVAAILEDYCRLEFGPEAVEAGSRLLLDIEEGTHDLPTSGARYRRALELEGSMEPWGRTGWRWTVVRARAAIDALRWEMQAPGTTDERRASLEDELRRTYNHLQHEIYLHDQERSLKDWIYSPFDVWMTLPLNELVLPTGVGDPQWTDS